MRSVGRVTVAVVVSLGVAAAVFGVQSIPDIRRYLRIRSM
jgi:hypothetical protein